MLSVKMLRVFGWLCVLCLQLCTQPVLGGNDERQIYFDVPSSNASQALNLFASQADIQLLYLYEEVRAVTVRGLRGRYDVHDGLNRLLDGTDLIAIATDKNSLTIRLKEKRGDSMPITKRNNNGTPSWRRGLLGLLIGGAAVTAHAQDATEGKRSALLEEVVVEARKRAQGEAVQDTPISMSAFGENQFKAVFADELIDIGRLSPNVDLKSGAAKGIQNFFIRGMGVSGSVASDQPAVGVFQNGVFWGMNYGSLLDTFDVESVQILRGPQGTLFGRNVTGGAVLVQTKRPDVSEGFGLDAEAVYGTHGRQDLSLAVEGPIVRERLAGRLVVLDRRLDGYFNNLSRGGRDFGASDTELVRGTLVWAAGDDVEITLIADRYKESGDPMGVVGIEVPGTLPYTNGFRQPSDWWDIRMDYLGKSDFEVDMATLQLEWNLEKGVLTAISGYRSVDYFNSGDFDGAEINAYHTGFIYDQDQLSQEVRYASLPANWGQFTLGGYYFEQQQEFQEARRLSQGTQNIAAGSALRQDSMAIFGEVDFSVSDHWTVTLGGRYTSETIEGRTVPFGACGLAQNVAYPDQILEIFPSCDLGPRDDETWTDFSPKAGVKWTANDDQLVFATVTRGFRSGGFSMRGNALLPPFDSEQVVAYELGYKGDMFDDMLRLNVAVFHNKFDDLQRTVLVPNAQTGVVQTTGNAARATIQGFEADILMQVTDGLALTFAYGYTDADYEEYEGLDVNGDRIPDPELAAALNFARVPKETYSASANYGLSLGTLGDLVFRLAWNKVGAVFHDDLNRVREPSYELIDASITFNDPSAHWEVSLFGKNLGAEEYSLWGASLGALGANRFVGPPRTAGVRVSYKL